MTTHKGRYCIKSVKHLKVDPEIIPSCDFSLGEALAQVYPLLDLIFQYLPLSDLKSCLEVSTTWREKAEEILARRVAPSWFTCFTVGAKGCKGNTLIHSPNLNFNNVDMGFILFDNSRIALKQYICLHSSTSELSRKSVPEYFEEELVPKSVNYCLLAMDRVLSNFNTKRSIKEISYYGSIFDGVFFPKVPSIRTAVFHCELAKTAEVEEIVKKHLRPNEVTKCVLLFTKYIVENDIHTLLKLLVPKENPSSVAVGGGIINGSRIFHQNRKDKMYAFKCSMCILFLKDSECEENNFEAYSCVIRGNASKEKFESKLLHFKENIKLKQHSLGFRISCSAKCQATALAAFQAIFPGLPLLGVDANGEIGWNSYNTARNPKKYLTPFKAKRRRQNENLPPAINYFSTTFVLITWDK